MRNHTITLLKAFAIILVVMAHAGSPVYLSRFSYMIGVSLFFMASGYFFNEKYLNDEGTFVKRRLKGLYVPFLKWSIILLVLHNLWFYTGILNETCGNATGGVTHPLNAHQWMQSLWSIVTNMSGYDAFLGGAFWFFRALLVSSIVFLAGFKCLSMIPCFHYSDAKAEPSSPAPPQRQGLSAGSRIAMALAAIALALALWLTVENLRWTGLAQGGYRELMGIFFLSMGYLYHRFNRWAVSAERPELLSLRMGKAFDPATPWQQKARMLSVRLLHATAALAQRAVWTLCHFPPVSLALSLLLLVLLVVYIHPSMAVRAHSVKEVLALALSGIAGFSFVRNLAMFANVLGRDDSQPNGIALSATGIVRRAMLFIGNNTLYIFAWHLLSFKLVSIIKVLAYGLPWEMVGGHPVVHSEEGSWFWVLYLMVGVALPAAGIWAYRQLSARISLRLDVSAIFSFLLQVLSVGWVYTTKGCRVMARWTLTGARWTGRMLVAAARFTQRALVWFFGGFVRGIVGFWNSLVDTIKDGSDVNQDE